MSMLLRAGLQTYDSHPHLIGVAQDEKQMLVPISHMIQNAQIEICITPNGQFISAIPLKNEKTVIPATLLSTGRTGSSIRPHALCDTLTYVSNISPKHFAHYVKNLADWANSNDSHYIVTAVLAYVTNGTIIDNLIDSHVIDKIENIKDYAKYLVRWCVRDSNKTDNCWENKDLFDAYISYHNNKLIAENMERDICMLSGEMDFVMTNHAKGTVALHGNAKLISANDNTGLTFRGRFENSRQAFNLGYTASQKAHNALKWIVENESVTIGDKTFVCWCPNGSHVPKDLLTGLTLSGQVDYDQYQIELETTLLGIQQNLPADANIVVAIFASSTKGRLTATYCQQMIASEFFRKIQNWYKTITVVNSYNRAYTPSFINIARFALGEQKGRFVDLKNDKLGTAVEKLLVSMLHDQPISYEFANNLFTKASRPQNYNQKNYEHLLSTAYAVIRKNKGDTSLELDTTRTDRSYLFGRLLAINEYIEKSTYDRVTMRETNALRLQSTFSVKPMKTWRILTERVLPYYKKHSYSRQVYFDKMIGEITDMLPTDPTELNKKLDDTYILGYYHQRNAFYKSNKEKEVNE